MSEQKHVIPQDDATRKAAPMCRGALDYFPAALFAVAAHSLRSDRKHNPGQPEGADPHWAREKSTDHDDCIVRHTAERGSDMRYHLTARAWRALASLQEYLEREGAAPGLASVFPSDELSRARERAAQAGSELRAGLAGGSPVDPMAAFPEPPPRERRSDDLLSTKARLYWLHTLDCTAPPHIPIGARECNCLQPAAPPTPFSRSRV